MTIDLARLQYLQRTDLKDDRSRLCGKLHVVNPSTGEGCCASSQKQSMTSHAFKALQPLVLGRVTTGRVCHNCMAFLKNRRDVDRFYRRQVDYSTGAEIAGTLDTRLAELTQQRKKAIRRAQEALKTAPEVEDKGAAQWVHVPGKHTVITVPNRGGTFV